MAIECTSNNHVSLATSYNNYNNWHCYLVMMIWMLLLIFWPSGLSGQMTIYVIHVCQTVCRPSPCPHQWQITKWRLFTRWSRNIYSCAKSHEIMYHDGSETYVWRYARFRAWLCFLVERVEYITAWYNGQCKHCMCVCVCVGGQNKFRRSIKAKATPNFLRSLNIGLVVYKVVNQWTNNWPTWSCYWLEVTKHSTGNRS